MNRRHLIKTTIGAAAATVCPEPTEPDFGIFAEFSVPVNPPGGSASLVCFTPWVEESQKMINQARAWADHHDLHVYTAKYRRRDDRTDHCYIILSPKPTPPTP